MRYGSNFKFVKRHLGGLSWQSSGHESASPVQRTGSELCSGKIPHATGRLNPCSPVPLLPNKRRHHSKKPTHRAQREALPTATRGSLHAATNTQHSHKLTNRFKKKSRGCRPESYKSVLCYPRPGGILVGELNTNMRCCRTKEAQFKP